MFLLLIFYIFNKSISVRANEGDAYVLGALPAGTIVHCIEKDPGMYQFSYGLEYIKITWYLIVLIYCNEYML